MCETCHVFPRLFSTLGTDGDRRSNRLLCDCVPVDGLAHLPSSQGRNEATGEDKQIARKEKIVSLPAVGGKMEKEIDFAACSKVELPFTLLA